MARYSDPVPALNGSHPLALAHRRLVCAMILRAVRDVKAANGYARDAASGADIAKELIAELAG